jgi:hypothetical protein
MPECNTAVPLSSLSVLLIDTIAICTGSLVVSTVMIHPVGNDCYYYYVCVCFVCCVYCASLFMSVFLFLFFGHLAVD